MDKNNKFQTGNVLTLSIAHLFHDIYTSFLAPILPLLIEKLGISLTMAGLLDVIRKAPSMLNPFVGLLADKMCVRYFVILSPGITAITMSLLGIVPNYLTLAILLFVAGISTTLFHVPAPVMTRKVSGKMVGRGMSFLMLGGELARTLGPLLITAAVSWWGLEKSYRVMPLGIVASIVLYFRLRNIRISDDFQKKKKEFGARETFMKLLPFFTILAGFTIFRSMIKLALTLYLPTYLTMKGQSLWLAGISLSILQFSGAGGAFIAGPLSDKIGRKKTLIIASIAMPILMFLFLISNNVFMIPLLVLLGIFTISTTPVVLALVQETDTEHPAFVNGIYMTIGFGVSSLMVLLIGFLSDKIGMEKTFMICTFASTGAIPFILMLKEKHNTIASVKKITPKKEIE
ncbi:MAG: MFS transporter [Candidatus Cloacimonetes bacterium]|nr:MFS transporter [Candidatus Cloacimonadota bacterium]